MKIMGRRSNGAHDVDSIVVGDHVDVGRRGEAEEPHLGEFVHDDAAAHQVDGDVDELVLEQTLDPALVLLEDWIDMEVRWLVLKMLAMLPPMLLVIAKML